MYILKNITTERDAKACYESAETRKIYYERLIAKLRSENKNKRVQLANSINVSAFQINYNYIIEVYWIFLRDCLSFGYYLVIDDKT